jgi:hypothetical protein
MAIPDFFKEFLRIFIQEISKISNFDYEVIWRTPKQLAKVMAIPKFKM